MPQSGISFFYPFPFIFFSFYLVYIINYFIFAIDKSRQTPFTNRKKRTTMKENTMNPNESLELIHRTIRETRKKLAHNAGTPMLTWGYSTIATTLIVWGVSSLYPTPYATLLWLLLPILGIVSTKIFFKKTRQENTYTLLDDVLRKIWVVIGGIAVLSTPLMVYAHVSGNLLPDGDLLSCTASIFSLQAVMLLLCVGNILSGYILRFKPAVIGGIIALLCLPLMQLCLHAGLPAGRNLLMLVFVVMFFAMGIVPGHLLNRQAHQ